VNQPATPQHRKLAALQLLSIAGAFICLVMLRVMDDFSVLNVADHSNRSLPLLYKITGTWGNHEGSMLLWMLVLAAFGLALVKVKDANHNLLCIASSIQAALSAGFLLFIIFTSNPFQRLFPAPMDGSEMNPLLQDIGIVMHPPLLYIGYVGFSSVFSLAIAALLQGNLTADWARITKPFLMIAWSSLTIGIGLGSWWAYRELGWGGWWFWDPVENASLLPWLAGTALLHCNISLEKRQTFKHWVLLLAILTFALSLLGTFLVRSGVLTSVHSFASDPARGMFILAYMAVTVGGGLLIYALKITRITSEERAEFVSREGMILVNNLFLITVCITVLLGTLYPLLAEFLSGAKITVGGPYYQYTALPLMVVPIILAGIAPLLPWKGGSIAPFKKRLLPALLSSLVVAAMVFTLANSHAVLAAGGFGLAAWLITLSILTLLRNKHAARIEQHKTWAVFLAHLGVAVLVLGITAEGLWAKQAEAELRDGEHITIGNYQVKLDSQTLYRTPNFMAKRADISLSDANGNHLAWLAPEFRFYPISGTTTSESAIFGRPWSDVYVVVGQSRTPETAAVRVYIKPMMQWIWAGFLCMTVGGLLSIAPIFSRRHA
jgi:cytochrome c-type biogenesis protein CcmF